jgi:hypothetical protein
MKKALRLFILLACSFGVWLPAKAQVVEPEQGANYAADSRAARISTLRTTYKIALSDSEKSLVSSRCQEAQKKLNAVASRVAIIRADRGATYTAVTTSLIGLRLQLNAKQIDASSLELITVDYQKSIAGFDLSGSAYETLLEDITQLDCVASPEDFRAALEGVRAAQKTLVEKAVNIEQITKSSLNTTLDSIILKLSLGGQTDGK